MIAGESVMRRKRRTGSGGGRKRKGEGGSMRSYLVHLLPLLLTCKELNG